MQNFILEQLGEQIRHPETRRCVKVSISFQVGHSMSSTLYK